MKATLPSPPATTADFTGARPSEPAPNRVLERLKISRRSLIYCGLLSALFCGLTWIPLAPDHIWRQNLSGRMIWQAGALPRTELVMPLAEGVPVVETGWAGNLLVHAAGSILGAVGFKLLFAGLVTLSLMLVSRQIQQQTRHLGLEILLFGLLCGLVLPELSTQSPLVWGFLCAALVQGALLAPDRRKWWLIPPVFVFWANFHPTFLLGLVWLFCVSLGTLFDVWCNSEHRAEFERNSSQEQSSRITRLVRSPEVLKSFWLVELAICASLLNPYGPWLYPAAVQQLLDPRLQDFAAGNALSIRSCAGMAVLIVLLLLFISTQAGRGRPAYRTVLPFVLIGLAAAWSTWNLVLWSPIAVVAVASEFGGGYTQRTSARIASPSCSGFNTAIAIILVWLGLSYSAVGATLLQSKVSIERDVHFSRHVPLGAASHLREVEAKGLIFNPAEWGDFLASQLHAEARVFATTNVERIPTQVWQDYQAILSGRADWQELLDLYDVQTVVLDPRVHGTLLSPLQRSANWKRVFGDDRSRIFDRVGLSKHGR